MNIVAIRSITYKADFSSLLSCVPKPSKRFHEEIRAVFEFRLGEHLRTSETARCTVFDAYISSIVSAQLRFIVHLEKMFSTVEKLRRKTPVDRLSRFQYLQALVDEFQATTDKGLSLSLDHSGHIFSSAQLVPFLLFCILSLVSARTQSRPLFLRSKTIAPSLSPLE